MAVRAPPRRWAGLSDGRATPRSSQARLQLWAGRGWTTYVGLRCYRQSTPANAHTHTAWQSDGGLQCGQGKGRVEIGMTYFLCQDQGVPVARGMGRHTNDHMVSFYMQSPSGFEVEYGWGARVVDDNTSQVQQHTRGSIRGHLPLAAEPAQQPLASRV